MVSKEQFKPKNVLGLPLEPDAPPEHPVVWAVIDLKDPSNVKFGFAQGAYRAYQLARIQSTRIPGVREIAGIPLCFSECLVMISHAKTEEFTRQCLIDLLVALGSRPRKHRSRSKRRLNGKGRSNGKGR